MVFYEKLIKNIYPLGFSRDFNSLATNSVFLVRDLKFSSLWKQHFNLSLFIKFEKVLCNISQSFITLISVFFCGHLGANQLDAASLGNTVRIIVSNYWILILTFFYSLDQ